MCILMMRLLLTTTHVQEVTLMIVPVIAITTCTFATTVEIEKYYTVTLLVFLIVKLLQCF